MSHPGAPYGPYGTEDAPVDAAVDTPAVSDAPVTAPPTSTSPYLSAERSRGYGTPDTQYRGLNPTDSYNPWAIASLALGLFATAIFAVIAGHVALSQIKRTGERGTGLAVAGLILGYAEILFYVGVFATAFGLLAWTAHNS